MDNFTVVLIATIVGVTFRTLYGWLEKWSTQGLPKFDPVFMASAMAAAIASVMLAIGLAVVFPMPETVSSQGFLFVYALWQAYGVNDVANQNVVKLRAPTTLPAD